MKLVNGFVQAPRAWTTAVSRLKSPSEEVGRISNGKPTRYNESRSWLSLRKVA
jgi:hypothetical protein